METSWTLQTPDGATIYGRKNAPKTPTRAAIFIVHGLCCTMHEYAYKRAADYFSRDYDVYRFNLYDGLDGARRLLDCTLQTHAADLNTVLNHFAPSYDRVFIIGHSNGGLVIMIANPHNVTAVSLWDPTFDLKKLDIDFASAYTPMGDYIVQNWGTSVLLSKTMMQERQHYDRTTCIQLAKDFKTPLQVVLAGNGYYVKQDMSYHSYGHTQNRKDIIKGTVHHFYEGKSCDSLLRKTKKWFESIR